MYPEEYSLFLRKRNALHANDVNGDIVFAEDVNELQEAIERLERHLGLGTEGIQERLDAMKGMSRLRVPTIIRLGETAMAGGAMEVAAKLLGYDSFIGPLEQAVIGLTGAGRLVLDIDVATSTLAEAQEKMGAARALGTLRVHLEGMAEVTRTRQQELVDSAHGIGMSVITDLTLEEVLDDTYDVVQNPQARPLSLHGADTLVITLYGTTATNIAGTIQPYIAYRQSTGGSLWLKANGVSDEAFERAQGIALLYGLDGMVYGDDGVPSIPEPPEWVPYLGDWRTGNPLVFTSGTTIERRIEGGKIRLDLLTNEVSFPGLSLNAQDIVFEEQVLNGYTLIDGTVTKEKIASLDPEMVVAAVNAGTTKIALDRIEDLNWDSLPGNIAASNMRTNVILAVNERAGVYGQPEAIVDAALAGMNASKLSGNIASERMVANVIQAVNSATGHIDVTRADIDTLNAIDITTQTVDTQTLISVEGNIPDFSSARLTSTERIDAKDIHAQYIKTIQLDADILKVKDMLVDDLISEKITTETLTAVMAHIGTAEINNLVAESIKAQIVKSELIVSMNSMIGEATIDGALIGEGSIINAQIVSLDAVKINTGSINTGLVTIDSPDGHLKISDENIRIYDAEDAQGMRRLRTILGNTGEIVPGSYGLVVLGADGTTRLYDNTGVYNAGIHENAISNEKLQDESVDGRVIIADSILARHITAEAITAEKIKAGEINALHIAAGTIKAGSAIIAEAAIGDAHISELDGGKITADSIEGSSIKAGTITTDLLSVGFGHNQVKYGYDNFEIFEEGDVPVDVFTPQTTAVVSRDIRRVGDQSLKISGNATEHVVYLQKMAGNHMNAMVAGKTFYVSAFMYTTDPTGVDVYTGIVHNDGTLWGPFQRIKQTDGFVRVVSEITIPEGVISGSIAIKTVKANAVVYVDCVMLEEKEETATEPSIWVSASITEVSGDMITTGTINATKGITFQAGAVVINADGIKTSKLGGGSVTMSDEGLVIKGGALTIEGGLSEDDLNPALTSKWNTASESIADLIDNNIITVYEKYALEKEWERMLSAFDSTFSQAVTYEVTGDARIVSYVNAKNAFQQYLFTTNDLNNGMPIMDPANKMNESQVNGAEYAALAKAVYDAGVIAQDAILGAMQSDIDKTRQGLEELDISPIFRIDIASSRGLIFKNGNIDTLLSARVWRGNEDITATMDASKFTWKRVSDDPDGDIAWGLLKGRGVKQVAVDAGDVNVRASFVCDVELPI